MGFSLPALFEQLEAILADEDIADVDALEEVQVAIESARKYIADTNYKACGC